MSCTTLWCVVERRVREVRSALATLRTCVRACAYVRACVRICACVRACVRACDACDSCDACVCAMRACMRVASRFVGQAEELTPAMIRQALLSALSEERALAVPGGHDPGDVRALRVGLALPLARDEVEVHEVGERGVVPAGGAVVRRRPATRGARRRRRRVRRLAAVLVRGVAGHRGRIGIAVHRCRAVRPVALEGIGRRACAALADGDCAGVTVGLGRRGGHNR